MGAAWHGSAAVRFRMATWTSTTRRPWTPILSRNLRATECAEPPMRFFARAGGSIFELIPRERGPEGGLAMSTNSARRAFIAVLAFFAVGVALSVGTAKAEDVTEDQILRAL